MGPPFGSMAPFPSIKGGRSRQNTSFIPNCTCRPGLDDVISPNVEPWLELGAPKIGVLVRLMNCVMNWKFVLSERENAFTMLKSEVASPGPRNAPAAQVPKVPGAA